MCQHGGIFCHYTLRVILSHRIRLCPTPVQERYFVCATGVARFAYNWALAECRRISSGGNRVPGEARLRKHLNSLKGTTFAWMRDVTKNAPQQAIKNLGRAFANYYDDLELYRSGRIPFARVRVPRFKKKGLNDRFRADNGTDKTRPNAVHTEGKYVKLPCIGWVRMREPVRFAGRIMSVTVSRQAGGWYGSFAIDTQYTPDVRNDRGIIGVDLGIVSQATLSDGRKFAQPAALHRLLKSVSRYSRRVTRKAFGSNNRAKARAKLARLHQRISNIRKDSWNKLTTYLTGFRTVVIEDLDVRGMLESPHFSRATAGAGFFEFRRQLVYKAKMASTAVIVADRWFPSSKLCSNCGIKNETLTASHRLWTCPSCGTVHDRDINAAQNLARYPESWAGAAWPSRRL